MKSIHRAGVAVALLALVLAGCSSGGHPVDPAPVAASQWLAVARGEVDVEGGMALVSPRTDGIVETVVAKPGDAVQAGAVLATLDRGTAKIGVATAEAGVKQASAELAELRVSLRQATARAPRVAEAAKAGAATGEAAGEARDAVASLTAKQAAAEAALEEAQQHLAAARLALAADEVRAPVAGTVVARRVSVGQAVGTASGEPLFEILPDRPHVIRAQLDVAAAGAIHPGMGAEVVADSGGGQVYSAKVLWVGEVLQPAGLTRDPLARALANVVDCTLELAPPPAGAAPLRIRQRVLVRFPRKP